MFIPYLALIRPSQANRGRSLTFGQTSQLKLKIRLSVVFAHRNYVIPLLVLRTTFSPHLGPIRFLYGLVQANQGWKFDFWLNLQIKIII